MQCATSFIDQLNQGGWIQLLVRSHWIMIASTYQSLILELLKNVKLQSLEIVNTLWSYIFEFGTNQGCHYGQGVQLQVFNMFQITVFKVYSFFKGFFPCLFYDMIDFSLIIGCKRCKLECNTLLKSEFFNSLKNKINSQNSDFGLMTASFPSCSRCSAQKSVFQVFFKVSRGWLSALAAFRNSTASLSVTFPRF